MKHTYEHGPVLVLGGTGKTGRRVAARLAARGLPSRIGSRRARPSFDWNDASTWADALDGVRAVYVAYQPDLALPGAVATVRDLTAAASARGVRRIVLLSGRGEPEAERAEEAVRESDAEWTIVRASWFAQNFSESFLHEGVRAGLVALPVGATQEPFVDADDIAQVAVAALTERAHIGRVYEVTGPRLLSFAEALGEIAAARGRPIRYRQVSLETFVAGLEQEDVPPAQVALLAYLFSTVLDGRNARLADGVRAALGRSPRDFASYARATAASGVWDAPAARPA